MKSIAKIQPNKVVKDNDPILKLNRLKDKGAVAFSIQSGKSNPRVNSIYICELDKVFGIVSRQILISIPGGGSAIMDINNISVSRLYTMGLTMKASGMLKEQLDTLYQIGSQG